MKTLYFLLTTILVYSCANPQKLLEKGKPDKALEISLRRLERGKPNDKAFENFRQSAQAVAARDRRLLNDWVASSTPELWPRIFELTQQIGQRQNRMAAVQEKLKNRGYGLQADTIPIRFLAEEAREKSAIYYYALAQEYVPTARSGNRPAARQAYGFLDSCYHYFPGFRQSLALQQEMRRLGTTHILLRPAKGPKRYFQEDEMMSRLLSGLNFPVQSGWQAIHLSPPEGQEIHLDLEIYFDLLYVSPDGQDVSTCCATAEVENGYTIRKEWSPQDSAYVEVKEIQYLQVSATVTTTAQYKDAGARLQLQLIDRASGQQSFQAQLYGEDSWSNEFTTYSGDYRALTGQCPSTGGSCWMFPSDWDMLTDAVDEVRWRLRRRLEKAFD